MSATLADKIRRSREKTIDVKGITFMFRRPTDIQMANMHAEFDGKYSKYEVAKRFVFGWRNVKESDLVPDGTDDAAAFDAAFMVWLDDARDYWPPLYEAIMSAYLDYSTERDGEVKN